jgi:hypothetical protein
MTGPGELEALERECAAPAHNKCLFVDVDDETGDERLENVVDWRRWMSWPRDPTIEEATAWSRWARAVMEGEAFHAVAAARARAVVAPPPLAAASHEFIRPAYPNLASD